MYLLNNIVLIDYITFPVPFLSNVNNNTYIKKKPCIYEKYE